MFAINTAKNEPSMQQDTSTNQTYSSFVRDIPRGRKTVAAAAQGQDFLCNTPAG
jgi:hypothetical protein